MINLLKLVIAKTSCFSGEHVARGPLILISMHFKRFTKSTCGLQHNSHLSSFDLSDECYKSNGDGTQNTVLFHTSKG